MLQYNIVIDEREKSLFDAILPFTTSLSTITLTKQILPLGDIIIQKINDDNTTTPIIIFERKCIADLLASIQDGRYKEQSTRLLHASGISPHNIVYLIEGQMTHVGESQRPRVYSAITSILIGKGMSVLRTWSIQESAELIARMTDKLARENMKSGGGTISQDIVSLPTTLTAIRKNNITRENIGEILLIQIPGISAVTAKAILNTFDNSFAAVLKAIQENNPALENIQYQTSDGKFRKISKGIVAILKELL